MLFYVWEDARPLAHWNHSFNMHLNCLGPVSCFSPFWIPSGCTIGGGCRGWWLHGLFTDTAGDSLCSQCFLLAINSTSIWEAFHDQFCPSGLGRLIPWSREDSVAGPLNVLICCGLDPVDHLKFSGSPVLLVCCDPGNVFPRCFFPDLELHYYNYSM